MKHLMKNQDMGLELDIQSQGQIHKYAASLQWYLVAKRLPFSKK
jgi:hypothetical protein